MAKTEKMKNKFSKISNQSKKYKEIGEAISKNLDNLHNKECIQIYRHLPDLEIECHFSKNKKYRYCLSVKKKDVEEGDTVCVIMQNPSYANKYIADKSVNFLENALFEHNVPVENVKKMIVVNLFAKIQTDNFQPEISPEENENINFIKKAIDESDFVIIGWGKVKSFSEERKEIVKLLDGYKGAVYETEKHPSLNPGLKYKNKLRAFFKEQNR